MKKEEIYIGTRGEITDMIMNSPKNYRACGQETLEKQLDYIETKDPKLGVVFMLTDHTENSGFSIDRFWLLITQ